MAWGHRAWAPRGLGAGGPGAGWPECPGGRGGPGCVRGLGRAADGCAVGSAYVPRPREL